MKNRILLTALTAGILGIGMAHADTSKNSDTMFKALDSNGDGQLSASELENMHKVFAKKRFEKADTNGDGKIGQDEFMAKAKARAEHMFKRMDKNGDGTVSESEAAQRHHGHRGHHGNHDKNKGDNAGRVQHMIKRMDTDGNGSISKSEWKTAMAKFHHGHSHDKADSTPSGSDSAE